MILNCGCPQHYPDWHQHDIDLGGHCVHSLATSCLLYMPLVYELYLRRQQQELAALDVKERWPGLALSRTGLFRGRLLRLLEPTTRSPSRRVEHLPYPFQIRASLHRGNVNTVSNTLMAMQGALLDLGYLPKEVYLCHLTCPTCRDQRGGDLILILRRWTESPRLKRRLKR